MIQTPKLWTTTSLKDLCDDYKQNIVDGPFGSDLKRSDYITDGIPVLKIQNIKENQIIHKKMDYITQKKYKELIRHSYKKGDIIMTKLGDPLGVSAIVKNNDLGIIVADLVRIRAKKIDTNYLCYYLNSILVRNYINSKQKGTTRPRVKLSIVRDLPIPHPSEVEQKRIVDKIEELFSILEHITDDIRESEVKAQVLRKSILVNSLNGRLGSKKIKYITVKLTDVVDVVSGQTPKGITNQKSDGNIPWYKVGDMNNATGNKFMDRANNTYSPLTVEKFKLRLLPEDTIIFPKRGGAIVTNKKRVITKKAAIDLNTMALIPYHINPEYLWVWLQTVELITWSNGSNVPQINHKDLEHIELTIPEKIQDQEAVAQIANETLTIIDSQIKDIKLYIDKICNLKQTILQKAYEGKLIN